MYNFGEYKFDNNLNYHIQKSEKVLTSSDVKKTGNKNLNLFFPITSNDVRRDLEAYLNKTIDGKFFWNFEYFQSGEPAGLHTDYEIKPWNNLNDSRIDIGVIIPLSWNCKKPYTVMYDKVSDIPRKLIFRRNELRYKDTDEVFEYRDKWEYDDRVLEYNPRGTLYYRQYADLKLHSAYEWQVGTMLVFDTKRWHSSSWFLSTDDLPDTITEYKRSIIGFGSIDVPRS